MAETRKIIRSTTSFSSPVKMMVLAVVLFVGSGLLPGTSDAATPTPAQCKLEKKLMINACTPLLYGNPPSDACCERIRVTDIGCVCPVITPQLAALIGDINRAIRIVQSCGRPVPRHFKCGSITTP